MTAVAAVRTERRALGFARAFYAFYYGAGACLMPFLAIYYSQLGFSGQQIGVLRGIAPLITLVAAPLWGALADATRRHKLVWLMAILGTWGAVLALSSTASYALLIAIVIGHALFGAPIVPLADSAVISLLGERRDRYGTQRFWGAIGWGISGLLIGIVIERYGLRWSFIGSLIMMACAGLMAAGIPVVDVALKRSYGKDLRSLLFNKSWLVFLLAMLIGGLYMAVEMSYLMLYMQSLGAGEALMGIALVLSTLGELPVWALAPFLLRRLGPRGLLSVALGAGAIQGLAFSLAPSAGYVLPAQLLHGLAFSAAWTAGVAYAATMAPPGTQATAQGLFGGVLMGLSASIGAMLGGRLFDAVGGAMMFRLAALTPLVALVLLWTGVRSRRA
jgi:MFS transporter, PPP family, 3-phenylpropionic acid transporter